jgi:hypothetical protein
MPSTFKYITDDKIAVISNKLYENVPVTGTVISGSYADANIINYSHDRYQTVFDYPYLSATANEIFALTVGYSNNSTMSSSANVHNREKILNYTEFAQLLQGYDVTGSVNLFDQDGDVVSGGIKLKEVVIIAFNRLLTKDGIKKGSFSATFFTGASWVNAQKSGVEGVNDYHATSSYFMNSPVGEWSYLSGTTKGKVGLIFYGPGVIILTASIFTSTTADPVKQVFFSSSIRQDQTVDQAFTGSEISSSCNGFRRRIKDVQFVNTTELNSTMYFLDIGANEFNFSSNPTYLSGSKIRVKDDPTDNPIAYFTEIGLYTADNELVAVAKISEPLKKTNSNNMNIRVRLDV